ncbi:MAG: SDR family oxidoreductase [Hyphomicrobiales bacterium]|jgi:2-deoxy-D-gluconate 3-dehydrogenase|nr:SDR family oxidoreductase [Hyphomicrobiales bacterium]|tara:strand:- start:19 stop:816 length:798 start_codon:yes stop_codon:yes gene_type:complete
MSDKDYKDKPSFDLTGRLIIVTGASAGIGREIAKSYANEGAFVIATARTEEKLVSLKKEIEDGGGNAEYKVIDITKVDEILDLSNYVQKVNADLNLDIVLLNNAGFGFTKPALDITEEEFNLITSTHLRGTFFCCQKIGKIMLEKGYGKIINMGSTWGEATDAKKAPYCMAKAGIAHMTRALSTEWAPSGVRVNTLAPTATLTEFTSGTMKSNPERAKAIVSRIKLGRFAMPSDHLGAAIFLASSASDFITGHTLYTDGGLVAAG